MTDYPVAELTPVQRLRVLAATIPGVTYCETTLGMPYEQVWAVVSDMDDSMPVLFRNFRSWRTVERDGERLRAYAVGRLGVRSVFDVTLRPGICIMQDRRFVGGMAAVADGSRGTRFAVLVGLRGPGRHLGRLLQVPVHGLIRRIARRLHTQAGSRPSTHGERGSRGRTQ